VEKFNSFDEIKDALKKKACTCQTIVDHYLSNIKAKAHLNAFVEVYEQSAREQALKVDDKLSQGIAGKLAGMVIGIKDILNLTGHPATAGSKILKGYISQHTATAIQRLIEEDAIIIGRLNCDEFGMGSSNENSVYGKVHNALDPNNASSFDTIGIFSKTIKDNALVMEVIAGYDEWDSTSSKKTVLPYSQLLSFDRKVKVAILQETLDSPALQSEIKKNTEAVLVKLEKEGHQVEAVSFPLLKYLLPTYYILSTAEASTNLSRFDGVKYGYRSPNSTDLESLYTESRSEGFGEEVKRRIMLGTFVLSSNYYDAYFGKAQKVRRVIKEYTEQILTKFDYILLPTTPTTAFAFGEHGSDPVAMYLEDLFTVQASVTGMPAISIPNGKDDAGMPIGLQVITNSFREADLYAFSDYLLKMN